jgi:hypothetical protein
LDAGPGTVSAGEDFHGQATLTNDSDAGLYFVSSPTLFGGVRRPGHTQMDGNFSGWRSAAGILVDLASGESFDVHLLVGTMPCSLALPPAILPDPYGVVARLEVNALGPNGAPVGQQKLTRIGPIITVTEPSHGTEQCSNSAKPAEIPVSVPDARAPRIRPGAPAAA